MAATAEAYREFQRTGGVIDLASRQKLLFTGADRLRYLNGQVTANLAAAKNPSVIPACVTTAKGKLCGDVFVSLGPEGILVDADSRLADSLPARMERYIVADDVTLADATDDVAIIHCIGIPADKIVAIIGKSGLPVSRYGIPGLDVFPPFRKDLDAIWPALSAEFPVLDEDLVETLRIEHGVPRWGAELNENTLPPEAGLDRTHIDYHKGCYIGQEVISRLKSVGHVNRRLVGFASLNGLALTPGSTIAPVENEEAVCGEITSATWSFALEKPIALGYLRRSAPTGEFVAKPPDPAAEPVPVTVCDLPFTS